jgi:hypothetical protein
MIQFAMLFAIVTLVFLCVAGSFAGYSRRPKGM